MFQSRKLWASSVDKPNGFQSGARASSRTYEESLRLKESRLRRRFTWGTRFSGINQGDDLRRIVIDMQIDSRSLTPCYKNKAPKKRFSCQANVLIDGLLTKSWGFEMTTLRSFFQGAFDELTLSILTESTIASRIGCTHSGYLGAEKGVLERCFEVGLEVEWVVSRKSTKRRFTMTFMSEKYW